MSFAALRLTLPTQGLDIGREMLALYRDVLVNQVLEKEDIGSHLEKIVPHLHNLNRMPLDGDTRHSMTRSLLRHYLAYAEQIARGATELDRHLAALWPECKREMCYAAKLLLRDCASQDKKALRQYLYWSVATLSEYLEEFSRQYRSQPGNLWGELHRLYYLASAQGIADIHGAPPDNRSIEGRYKQTLLLTASQPEHLSRTEQMIITGYLQKWSFRAALGRQESPTLNSHYYYVDLDSHLSLQSARDLQGIGNDETIRVLNPLPLIEQARKHMKQLRTGLSADKIGMAPGQDAIDLFMTLKKAIACWRQDSTRRFERYGCNQLTQAAIGLSSIHHYLRRQGPDPSEMITTRTLNRSKLGACIEVAPGATQLDVGDILIHRDSGDDEGRLAVVRWLKHSRGYQQAGLEYIAGNLQPVSLRQEDQVAEALLISTADSDSLITLKGQCTGNTAIRLKPFKQGPVLEAKAQSLVQRGQSVDQIRLKRTAV
ncbi:MAG: hypothetical protein ACX931_05215 [Saccharospirillum sp.]